MNGANDSILGTIKRPNATLPTVPSTMAFNPNNNEALYVAVGPSRTAGGFLSWTRSR